MKEKIAVWGTGKVAKKFYILYCKEFDVVCFFDNKVKGYKKEECEKLYGVPILRWSPENTYKIVIASSFWREIADQLNEYGLLPFKDYVLWTHMIDCETVWYSDIYELVNMAGVKEYRLCFKNKKIAVVYGNCQTRLIGQILKSNKSFGQDYVYIITPMVHEYEINREMVECFINDENFWKQVDLFIYQSVSKNNKFSPILCTDRIKYKLKETCKKVEILNLYFDGYFPQVIVGGGLKYSMNLTKLDYFRLEINM